MRREGANLRDAFNCESRSGSSARESARSSSAFRFKSRRVSNASFRKGPRLSPPFDPLLGGWEDEQGQQGGADQSTDDNHRQRSLNFRPSSVRNGNRNKATARDQCDHQNRTQPVLCTLSNSSFNGEAGLPQFPVSAARISTDRPHN